MDDSCVTAGIDWPKQPLPDEMLTAFLDAMPAHTALLDGDGVVVAVNKPWRDFSTSCGGARDAYLGMNYLTVAGNADDEDARMVAGGLVAVMRGGLSSFQHDYPCHDRLHQRWFRCLVVPLRLDGRIHSTMVMHIDITPQKMAEERARAANRAKSDFLANLSHELRTPLNAIIGFSEIIMMGTDRACEYAADIHGAGKHLLSLINEVLDLSKVEAGRYVLREEPVVLPEIISQSLHMMESKASAAGLSLTQDMAEDLPALVSDARLVRQILLNLLSNAIKFTPSGGTVATFARLASDGWLELGVADSGIGIAPTDIARVLEPFGQIDSEMARAHIGESTGLGLPLVRNFVDLHQGTFAINSTPGRGTTVTARFPPTRIRYQ